MHGCVAPPKLIIMFWIYQNLPSNHRDQIIKMKPMYRFCGVCIA